MGLAHAGARVGRGRASRYAAPVQPPPPRRRWKRSARGRILAIKWGYNPNSSSLGVDVTFLLFGTLAVALLTPLIALFLRLRGSAPPTRELATAGDPPSPSLPADGAAPRA